LGQQKKNTKLKMYLILVFVLFWKKHRKKKKRGELKTESAKHTVLNLARGRTTESVDGSGFLGAPR